MANRLFGLRTRRVDVVDRASVRDTLDKSEPNRFLVYKAESASSNTDGDGDGDGDDQGDDELGTDNVKHTHAKVGGGTATHDDHAATKGHKHDGLLPLPKTITKAEQGLDAADYCWTDDKGGHLQVNDAAHVRAAMARFNQTDFPDAATKKAAAAKILARAKTFGVEVADDNPLTAIAKSDSTEGDPVMPDETQNTGTPAVAPPATDPAASINKAELPEPVRIALEKAESRAAAAEQSLEDVRKSATAATEMAQAERNLRLTREYMAKAELLVHLPWTFPEPVAKADGTTPSKVEALASALRQLDEQAPDAAAVLNPMLKSAEEMVAKGEMFREIGIGAGQASASSPAGRIEQLAREIQKSETGTSFEQAYVKAMDQNPELAEQMRTMPVVGGGGRQR